MQLVIDLGLTDGEVEHVLAFWMAVWQNVEGAIESLDRLSSGVKYEADRAIRVNFGENVVGAKWHELSKWRLNPAVRCVDNLLAQHE